MHDAVGALQGAHREVAIADVAHDELDAGGEIRLGVAVDLGLEAVEDDDVVAALDERAHQV